MDELRKIMEGINKMYHIKSGEYQLTIYSDFSVNIVHTKTNAIMGSWEDISGLKIFLEKEKGLVEND